MYEKEGRIHRLFRRLVVMNISTNVVMSRIHVYCFTAGADFTITKYLLLQMLKSTLKLRVVLTHE